MDRNNILKLESKVSSVDNYFVFETGTNYCTYI